MTCKVSCFSPSRPLLQENFRRCWPIPVIGFLIYFLCGVFPILLSYRNLSDFAYYIGSVLRNEQPFLLLAHLSFPILTAVVLFRYLQNTSSVAVMHAMPFRRITLYNSHFLSGLLLISIPILANGLILLAISKPVPVDWADTADVFSRMMILRWIFQSLLIVIFLYTVSVFAGMITGNSIMHFCTAVAFNFLLPALHAVLISYFKVYLFGFYIESGESFSYALSPFLATLSGAPIFTPLRIIFYLGMIVFLFFLSALLYERRKLEKTSDALVYSFCEPAICYLIAFFTMTAIGTYFKFLGDYSYIGYFCGALLGFLIGRIVVKKTVWIFNVAALKSFGIYLLIAVLFFLSLEFDAFSYEGRIPSEKNIKSISMDYALSYNYNEYRNYDELKTKYKDPDNLQQIISFHKQIIGNRDKIVKYTKDNPNGYSSILFTYKTDSGRTLNRYYEVPRWLITENKNLKTLYESSEFRTDLALLRIPEKDLQQVTIHSRVTSAIDPSITTDDLKGLIQALNQDVQVLTYEQLCKPEMPLCSVEIKYIRPQQIGTDTVPLGTTAESSQKIGEDPTETREYSIRPSYTQTIAWLNRHGYNIYTEYMKVTPLYAMATLSDTSTKSIEQSLDSYYNPGLQPPEEHENLMVITDLSKIKQLYELGETMQFDSEKYYRFQIVYAGRNGGAAPTELYIHKSNAPDYISEYFK